MGNLFVKFSAVSILLFLFCYEALLSGLQYHSFYPFFNLHIYIEAPLGVMGIKDIWVKN